MRILREFINEVVHDARDAFKLKRSRDLLKKVSSVAHDAPDVIAQQEQQIHSINAMLTDAKMIPNRIIDKKALRLAAPLLYGDEGFGHDASIFDIIATTPKSIADPLTWDQLKKFVGDNVALFKKSISDIEDRVKQIEDHGDSQKWFLNWRRYTNYQSFASDLIRYKANIRDLLS